MTETGASLEWLATGVGRMFNDEEPDILRMPRRKIVDGQPYDSGSLMLDKVTFLPGKPLPKQPLCVIDGFVQYIVNQSFSEVFDDQWLFEVEGKMSVRTLTRIPVKKVRVSRDGMAYDCSIEDIKIIGRVVLILE